MMKMLSGIVLAGGESLRMRGKIKALLPLAPATFLENIIAGMRATGAQEIIVVVGAHAAEIMKAVDLSQVKVVINESWRLGQIQSLRRGLDEVSENCEGVLVNLVDHPLVQEVTYITIADEWRKTKEKVIIPVINSRRGHPVVFPRLLFNIIQSAFLPEGARGLIREYPELIREVPVTDAGVVMDIDTPEEYEKIVTGNQ